MCSEASNYLSASVCVSIRGRIINSQQVQRQINFTFASLLSSVLMKEFGILLSGGRGPFPAAERRLWTLQNQLKATKKYPLAIFMRRPWKNETWTARFWSRRHQNVKNAGRISRARTSLCGRRSRKSRSRAAGKSPCQLMEKSLQWM